MLTQQVWKIGRRDPSAYNDIDNYLISADQVSACRHASKPVGQCLTVGGQIPEVVRNKRHNRYMDILPTPEVHTRL